MKFGQRALERILNQVIGPVTVPRQRTRIAPQAGNVLGNCSTIHQRMIATSDLARANVPDFIDAIAGIIAGLVVLDPEDRQY